MARLIAALVIFGALMVAVKIAIIVLILAGLIFRTKETIGLLLVGGLLTLLSKHPVIGWPLLGLLVILGIVQACRGDSSAGNSSSTERLERLDRAIEKHEQARK